MGAFFTVYGFAKVDLQAALSALEQFEHEDGVRLDIFRCASGALVGMVDELAFDSAGLLGSLSGVLGVPVIELSFSDDVVWGYVLYSGIVPVDRYSSRPNYWSREDGREAAALMGNAAILAQYWPGVREEEVSRYLTNKEELSEDESDEHAYPDDSAPAWDAWQMCDFMKRLGLTYPVDEDGALILEPVTALCVSTAKGLEQKAAHEARMEASRRRPAV